MSTFRCGVLLFALLVTSSSATSQDNRQKCKPTPSALESVEPVPLPLGYQLEDQSMFPARGGEVDVGLAMSGGGIRSASFNIGVLKALFDQGILDDVDVISSVSGGGFASYWLYGLHAAGDEDRFGNTALGNERFTENMCSLKAEADMYSLPKMLRALLRSRKGAFADYRSNIHRTFGRNDQNLCSQPIDGFAESIKNKKAPYMFINTSLDTGELVGLANVIEMTPTHIGNPQLGYSKWSKAGESVNFLTSIATSAAGIRWKLKRGVSNFAPYSLNNFEIYNDQSKPKKEIDLFDGGGRLTGGGGENLAALALIRRGVKNVIIVDAGHDPNYTYQDLQYLRHLLKGLNIDLCVSEANDCTEAGAAPKILKTGVLTGFARNASTGKLISRIFFIKMSRPEAVFPKSEVAAIAEQPNTRARRAWIDEVYKTGSDSKDRLRRLIAKDGSKKAVVCSQARNHPFSLEMYDYSLKSYAYFLNHSNWRNAAKVHSFLAYDFPQTSTVDQSFYADQFEAFVGLGLRQGNLFAEQWKRKSDK